MKKFLFLCGLMMISLNIMAQIDNNWTPVINDNFSDFIGWNANTFVELNRFHGYLPVWECYMKESHTGVTTSNRHQAYQTSQVKLSSNNKLKLVAEYVSSTPLDCGIDYTIPVGKSCTNNEYPNQHPSIFYFSGTIETTDLYWFGYYEMKCKLPVHDGEKTSFWLYGTGPHSYEEIDIFEHSEDDSSNNLDNGFSCGIWYNPDSTNYTPNNQNNGAHNTVKAYYVLDEGVPNLTNEHTYACEWLPNRITWFFDGKVILECCDRNEIPQHPLRLKVTHPVTDYAMNGNTPGWQGTDAVIVNYVKYFEPMLDCNTDVYIRNVNDIYGYQPGVKHSITLGSSNGLEMPMNTEISFRASESITFDNEFTIPTTARVSMIIHDCP